MNHHYPEQFTDKHGVRKLECRCGNSWPCILFEPQTVASHLSQSSTDTAKPLPQNLEAWLDQHTPEIGAYWKSKEGICLACGLEIAIQDQYCGDCESFLSEMYDKGDN
jgi:hypothetical protein